MDEGNSQETSRRKYSPFTDRLQSQSTKSESEQFENSNTNPLNEHDSVKTYKNAREYARDLQTWMFQYRTLTMMQYMMPFNLMNNTLINSPHYTINNNVYPNVQQTFHPVRQQYAAQPQVGLNVNLNVPAGTGVHVIRGLTGTEYEIPPLWKRMCAELIDFVVLFYMKIIVAIAVMRQMGYMNVQNDNLLGMSFHMDLSPILEMTEGDLEKIFSITSEVIALEIVNRIFITFFEALCIRQGFASPGGATPGKRVMGLKVVSCDQIVDLPNNKVIVIPARNTGFISALVRSVIKNFTLAFLFPACFTVFIFNHKRAAYDVIAKTIVVQVPLPNHLRRHAHAH